MKRRLIATLFLILIVCSIFTAPVLADSPALDFPEEPIEPESPYVKIDFFTATISINSSGKASCYSYVSTATSDYSIYLSMSLERYDDGWYTIKTWTGSGTGSTYLDKDRYVVAGHYYRVSATATVRTSGGSFVEAVTIYSPSEYY